MTNIRLNMLPIFLLSRVSIIMNLLELIPRKEEFVPNSEKIVTFIINDEHYRLDMKLSEEEFVNMALQIDYLDREDPQLICLLLRHVDSEWSKQSVELEIRKINKRACWRDGNHNDYTGFVRGPNLQIIYRIMKFYEKYIKNGIVQGFRTDGLFDIPSLNGNRYKTSNDYFKLNNYYSTHQRPTHSDKIAELIHESSCNIISDHMKYSKEEKNLDPPKDVEVTLSLAKLEPEYVPGVIRNRKFCSITMGTFLRRTYLITSYLVGLFVAFVAMLAASGLMDSQTTTETAKTVNGTLIMPCDGTVGNETEISTGKFEVECPDSTQLENLKWASLILATIYAVTLLIDKKYFESENKGDKHSVRNIPWLTPQMDHKTDVKTFEFEDNLWDNNEMLNNIKILEGNANINQYNKRGNCQLNLPLFSFESKKVTVNIVYHVNYKHLVQGFSCWFRFTAGFIFAFLGIPTVYTHDNR